MTPLLDLTGRTAVVIGGNDGIGLGIARGLVCDVGAEESVTAAFAEARARLGPLDCVVACAGTSGPGVPFLEQALEDWRRVLRTNLEGPSPRG